MDKERGNGFAAPSLFTDPPGSGDRVESYSIEIVRVLDSAGVQNLLVQVTDPALIEQTGGIVQGMSGSRPPYKRQRRRSPF